ARGVSRVAAGIGRQAFAPERGGDRSLPVFVLVLEGDLTVPSRRVGSLRSDPIRSQREVELVWLALVLQCAAGAEVGVVVEAVERRVEHQLVDVLAVQRSIVAGQHGAPGPAD